MKKATSILFLTAFILASTELHQLFKLPGLVNHFIQHRKEDTGISFIGFLKMHYAENNPHTAKHTHDNLPFKSHSCGINHTVVAEVYFFSTAFTFTISPTLKKPGKFSETFYSSSLQSNIWQPPKIG